MNARLLMGLALLVVALLSQSQLSLAAERKREKGSKTPKTKQQGSKQGAGKEKVKKSSSSGQNSRSRELADTHESCEFWANLTPSECEKNPTYMLTNCAKSCTALGFKAAGDADVSGGTGGSDGSENSFYGLVETDLYGNEMRFDIFRGKVVYIVNVASQCGYTAEGYELLRSLQDYEEAGLELVIAPCNQFGGQEPGNPPAIAAFARKQGFVGRVLSKADVNGDKTRPLYKFLKAATGKSNIDWNFDGKFLVLRDGSVRTLTGDSKAVYQEILEQLGEGAGSESL